MRVVAPFTVAAGLAIGGCASADLQVGQPLKAGVGRVSLSIQNAAAGGMSQEQSDSFRAILTQELQRAGIEVVSSKGGAPAVTGSVSKYDPGSQALRYFIGFGAGRGSLASTWSVQDLGGKVLGACTITGSISAGIFGGHFDGVLEKAGVKLAEFLKGPGGR